MSRYRGVLALCVVLAVGGCGSTSDAPSEMGAVDVGGSRDGEQEQGGEDGGSQTNGRRAPISPVAGGGRMTSPSYAMTISVGTVSPVGDSASASYQLRGGR